jgi:lysophospholipase L1-like esterase
VGPTLRNILFALVPSIAIAVIGGVIGEVYLRAQHADLRKAIESKVSGRERCTQASADRLRIYEGIPNKCDQNGLGFRDVEHSLQKPDGVYRIVLIGDSVAMGQGVPPPEALGKVLERAMSANGAKVEVIVLAVTGYSTSQELALLEIGHRYRPDLIVWTYVLNDPADPIVDNANGELGAYFHAPTSYALDYLATLWTRSVRNFKARNCPDEWHLRMHCAYRDEIEHNFAAIARSAREHSVPVVVFIIPLLPEGAYRTYDYATVHGDVRALATAQGLRVIDGLAAFDGIDVEELRLQPSGAWRDPWHPNGRGHALLGDYLAKELGAVVQPSKRTP